VVFKDKRNPANQERPYKLSDVKRCFPLASDALIGRWIEKGYVSHGVKARGALRLFTFTVSEVVHIGVLMQASAFGITKATAPIEVGLFLPPIPTNDMTFPPPPPQEICFQFFSDADSITYLYERARYDFVYSFRSKETLLTTGAGRNKKGFREYYGKMMFPWLLASSVNYELNTNDSIFMMNSGTLLIHVGAIANWVGRGLGLGNLWKPRGITV